MQIGRRIYYDRATGSLIQDTGERMGDVIETTTEYNFITYGSLLNRESTNTGIIDLAYGERTSEFRNIGSMIVMEGNLIIYPHLITTVDKKQILANGIDTATITVTTQGNENVLFTVEGIDYVRIPIDGVCTFTVDSDLPGTITVTITSVKYGQAVVTIEVI